MAENTGNERIFTVNLSKAYSYTRTKRARRSMNLLREFISRHMKTPLSQIRISEQLNSSLWQYSMQRPLRYVKIKVEKKEDIAYAKLPDEKPAVKKPPKQKGSKAKSGEAKKTETKQAEAKKPEAKKEETKKDQKQPEAKSEKKPVAVKTPEAKAEKK